MYGSTNADGVYVAKCPPGTMSYPVVTPAAQFGVTWAYCAVPMPCGAGPVVSLQGVAFPIQESLLPYGSPLNYPYYYFPYFYTLAIGASGPDFDTATPQNPVPGFNDPIASDFMFYSLTPVGP